MTADAFMPGRTATAAAVESPGVRAADEIVARLERLPFGRFQLHMAAVLAVGTFFDAFDGLSMGVAITAIFTTLNIDRQNAGYLISATAVGGVVGALAAGAVAERIGRKNAFVGSLAIFGAFSILSALAWNYETLLVSRVLQGIGIGGEVPIAAALFSECVRGKTRGKVVMLYESVYIWGIFLMPLVGLVLFQLLPQPVVWRALFAFGGIPLLMAIYAYFRLPESPRWLADKGRTQDADRIVSQLEADARSAGVTLAAPEPKYRADVKKTRLWELFSPAYARRTALVWVQGITNSIGSSIILGWLPTMYIQIGGLSTGNALLLTVVQGAFLLVVGYCVAFTIDRWGRRPLFLVGFGLMIVGALVGLVLTTFLHFTAWPMLFATGLITMFGVALNLDGQVVYVPELYPTRMRAWGQSATGAWGQVARIVGPIATGALLVSALGIAGVWLLLLASALLGLVVMAAFGIETKQRVLEELSA